MKIIFKSIAVILLASTSFLQAEIVRKDDSEVIKRKVLVLIEEPNSIFLSEMKPEQKEVYLDGIAKYNENMKEAAAKLTVLAKNGMEFKTPSEILILKNTKQKNHLVLNMIGSSAILNPMMGGYSNIYFLFNEVTNIEKSELRNKKNTTDADIDMILFLNRIEDYGDLLMKNPVRSVTCISKYPSKISLAAAVQFLNYSMSNLETEVLTGVEVDGSNARKEICAKNLNKVVNSKFVFLKESIHENYDTKSMNEDFSYKFEIKSGLDLYKNPTLSDTNSIYVSVTCNYSKAPGLIPGYFEIVNHEGKIVFYNKVKTAGTTFGNFKVQEKLLKKIKEEIKEYQQPKK